MNPSIVQALEAMAVDALWIAATVLAAVVALLALRHIAIAIGIRMIVSGGRWLSGGK